MGWRRSDAAEIDRLAEHALATVDLEAVRIGHHHGAGVGVAALLHGPGPLVLGRERALHDDLIEVLPVLVVLVAQPDQAPTQGAARAVGDLVAALAVIGLPDAGRVGSEAKTGDAAKAVAIRAAEMALPICMGNWSPCERWVCSGCSGAGSLYGLCGLILNNRTVHLSFSCVSGSVANTGSTPDMLEFPVIQEPFSCLIRRPRSRSRF